MEQPVSEPVQHQSESTKAHCTPRHHWWKVLIGSFFIVLTFVLLFLRDSIARMSADSAIDTGSYQMVTLDTGRSYFGTLSGLGDDYATLENAFFLQAKTPELNEAGEVQPTPEGELPFVLQRVGNQVYEGSDDLSIKAEHIVSWQNLKEDSQVVQTIQEYIDKKPKE